MLEMCQKCNDGFLRFATWKLFSPTEKSSRNLPGETDYQVTHRKCDACGHSEYRAKPLTSKTPTIC